MWIKVRFARFDNGFRKIAESIFLSRCVLVGTAASCLSDETQVHPRPIFHCIGHNRDTLAQVKPADQLVNRIFEGIDLLWVSIMLSPVGHKLFSSVSREPDWGIFSESRSGMVNECRHTLDQVNLPILLAICGYSCPCC